MTCILFALCCGSVTADMDLSGMSSGARSSRCCYTPGLPGTTWTLSMKWQATSWRGTTESYAIIRKLLELTFLDDGIRKCLKETSFNTQDISSVRLSTEDMAYPQKCLGKVHYLYDARGSVRLAKFMVFTAGQEIFRLHETPNFIVSKKIPPIDPNRNRFYPVQDYIFYFSVIYINIVVQHVSKSRKQSLILRFSHSFYFVFLIFPVRDTCP